MWREVDCFSWIIGILRWKHSFMEESEGRGKEFLSAKLPNEIAPNCQMKLRQIAKRFYKKSCLSNK